MTTSDENSRNIMPSVLARLREVASSVMRAAEAESVGEVLERIADAARELVGARYAALGIPDGRGGLEFFEVSGVDDKLAPKIGHHPLGRGLIGAIMSERQPIRVDHMTEDPRFYGFPKNHPPMDRFLGVPIIAGNQLFGQLYLADRLDGMPFSKEDQWYIETLAGYAALVIAGTQLREQQQRVTLLEERERISMDLHDGVIQSLYAIGMHLEIMRLNDKPPSDDELKDVVSSLNDIIEDIRRYIQDLTMRQRYGRVLREFIYDITRRLHVPDSLKIHIETPGEPLIALTPILYDALRQMANEALSNVIRHSKATHVRISAQQSDRVFQLKIADNGVGFDNGLIASGDGLGLRNIQQRARLHEGDVYIDTAPGRGTCITFSLPVKAAERSA